MTVLAFDWGGTSVKYGLWEDEKLTAQNSFPTPKTWPELKAAMKEIQVSFATQELAGVAISAPGAVDSEAGVIAGISAIPYIHHFLIQEELAAYFGLPVSLENDANCAGIAEVWQGAAKGLKNVIFLVLGTGVGGAIIEDGIIKKGSHLYGGEFGLIYLNEEQTFSDVGTVVKLAERYCAQKGLALDALSGQEVFALAAAGDTLAQEEVEKFYNYVAKGIFSVQFTTDPECIVIGGGISARPGLIAELEKRVDVLFTKLKLNDFRPQLKTCQFQNDANLIGAVAHFYQSQP